MKHHRKFSVMFSYMWLGLQPKTVFSTWTIPDDEKDKIEPLVTRFKTYCEGKRNITVIRYNFNARRERPGGGFTLNRITLN